MHKINLTLFAIACGLFLAAGASAQNTNAPRTDMEVFEARSGIVIVRGSADMGTLTTASGTISVKCKESIEVNSGRKQYAVTVTLTGKNRQADTTIIDYVELDSVLGALDFLANANWSLTTLPSFDAVYATRDGLQAAAYSSQKRPGTLGASLKSSRAVFVRVSLTPQELAEFRGLMQQAKARLDALRSGN